MIVVPADSAQRTRFRVQVSGAPVSLGSANTDKAFAVALVSVSWREKLVGQDSWPNWTNLKGLHSDRGLQGNKRFFPCNT